MSVSSKRARRVKRRTLRAAAWDAIRRHGAMVSPDVWERLKALAPEVQQPTFPLLGSYQPLGAIRIRVEPMLQPGTIMPMPALLTPPRLGMLDWSPGTHVKPSGLFGFSPKLGV